MTVELLPAGSSWRVFHFSSVSLLETLAIQSVASFSVANPLISSDGSPGQPISTTQPNPGLPSLTLKMGSLSDIPQNMRPGDASLQADVWVQRTALGANSEAVGLRAWQRRHLKSLNL